MTLRHRLLSTLAGLALLLTLSACATSQPAQVRAAPRPDGYPAWIDEACDGQPADTICAVGESDLVAASVEAGKTDAETAAQNRLQSQIEADLGRLLERLNEATKDLSNGRVYGQQTVRDINRNFSEKTLRGVKFAKYYYHPSRMEPKKVFVLAIVNPNTVKLSEDIMQSLLAAGERDRLLNNHREAQVRYDAVRKEYLAEKAEKEKAKASAAAGGSK